MREGWKPPGDGGSVTEAAAAAAAFAAAKASKLVTLLMGIGQRTRGLVFLSSLGLRGLGVGILERGAAPPRGGRSEGVGSSGLLPVLELLSGSGLRGLGGGILDGGRPSGTRSGMANLGGEGIREGDRGGEASAWAGAETTLAEAARLTPFGILEAIGLETGAVDGRVMGTLLGLRGDGDLPKSAAPLRLRESSWLDKCATGMGRDLRRPAVAPKSGEVGGGTSGEVATRPDPPRRAAEAYVKA